MNAKVIKDYNTSDLVELTRIINDVDNWDLIELNYSLNAVKLAAWYAQLSSDYAYLRFNFNDNRPKLDVEVSERMVAEGYCGLYCGPIDGITLSWPIERDEPLPPPKQANPIMFPEVNTDNFYDTATIMSKFKNGYLVEMLAILGEESFKQMIITTHYPNMYIRQHQDSKILKLHIPVETNPNALFHFGEHKERSYHMKLGKIYVLNSGEWHGTTNESDQSRSHIITRISNEHLAKIMSM